MQAESGLAASAPGRRSAVLIAATLLWPLAARMAIAFRRAGCEVHAVCPRGHPLESIRSVTTIERGTPRSAVAGLRAALVRHRPQLIVPCDDRAALDLVELWQDNSALRQSITAALGPPEAIAIAGNRAEVMALARGSGIPAPRTITIGSESELCAEWKHRAVPALLKLDGTCGGEGVWPVASLADAVRAYAAALRPVALHEAMVRRLGYGDAALWQRWRSRWRPSVSLQDAVAGQEANCAVACRRGEVLAYIGVEVLQRQRPRGPATVLRVIEHPQMLESARRLIRRLEVSGIWGLDFVIDPQGAAQLIEVNPRATPAAHLAWQGQSALVSALVGAPGPALPPAVMAPAGTVFALFPGEWQRDPGSPYLVAGHFDVPWEEPDLVHACLRHGVAVGTLASAFRVQRRPAMAGWRNPI